MSGHQHAPAALYNRERPGTHFTGVNTKIKSEKIKVVEGKVPRCRWEDNIGMDLQEVGCGYVDWIGLAQDRDR